MKMRKLVSDITKKRTLSVSSWTLSTPAGEAEAAATAGATIAAEPTHELFEGGGDRRSPSSDAKRRAASLCQLNA
jgi:hypothetical protein